MTDSKKIEQNNTYMFRVYTLYIKYCVYLPK